jgi:hypothetical protein
MMNIATIVAIVVAILAIAVAVWAVLERQKTLRLRKRFGPEYDRVSQANGTPVRPRPFWRIARNVWSIPYPAAEPF